MIVFKKLMDRSETLLAAICVAGFALMLGLGCLTVLFRFIIQSSLAFPDEMIRYLFVWLVALGSAVALRRNMHAAIGILVKAMPGPLKRAALMIAALCSILFLAILVYTGWHATLSASGQISAAMEISKAWLFASVPIGAFFGILFSIETLITHATTPAAMLVVDDH